MNFKRILIIAAHPDDDILGVGGFISKYNDQLSIRVIFIAEGTSCRYSSKQIESEICSIEDEIEFRNNCAKKALAQLNVENYHFYNLRCGRLDQTPLLDLNKIIEEEISNYKPDTIFTHSDCDLNLDHQKVSLATTIATRPKNNSTVSNILFYEILSSSEWKFTDAFLPNYFVKLSEDDVERKWKALSCYESEISQFPHPRSEEGIYTLARYRGMQSGTNYAEAFKLLRCIE